MVPAVCAKALWIYGGISEHSREQGGNRGQNPGNGQLQYSQSNPTLHCRAIGICLDYLDLD